MDREFNSAEALVDALIASVGKNIVLGLPIGIGKAIRVVDALFLRATNDPSISLTIFTGLTLETPTSSSDLEARFLEPLNTRLYSKWPTPEYAKAVAQQNLPPNISVQEFYLRPGGYLSNRYVQQNYASINYSQVAAELTKLGVNVITQLVAKRSDSPGKYSLSSNPEITLDLLPHLNHQREQGKNVALIGETNQQLPYMLGDAELGEDQFDYLLDDPANDFPLFTLVNRSVQPADYATAMHVASLVRDGGTLQIGVGSFSDAVAHCLILRHKLPDVFAEVLSQLPGGSQSEQRQREPIEVEPFKQGLFASTELMSDALFELFAAGIIKRPADKSDPAVVHAGFLIGSASLIDRLNGLDESRRKLINMTSISEVNTLFGDEHRKRQQRRQGSFVNEVMMATLLGAGISDALEDGRVVSGVGGQFDFVSMAHSLDDGQSILMLRSTRPHKGVAQSNIRWQYAHTTVPRHHRDAFVSEYGIAFTRGRTDSQVIDAMVRIADAEFQPALISQAKQAGKIAASYTLGNAANSNSPEAVTAVINQANVKDHFPLYPFGTELTDTEQTLIPALAWLKNTMARPWSNKRALLAAVTSGIHPQNQDALERMNLAKPANTKERLTQRLLNYALTKTASQG